MGLSSLSQFLLLASWFAFTGLVFILALIARFYENLSGRSTYYRLFAIPVLAMGGSLARYVGIGRWAGDWLGDGLAALSGGFLLVLCYKLYRDMTAHRK